MVSNAEQHPILFFDGYCNLCNNAVDTVMKLDKRERIRYASLQGETAQKRLDKKSLKDVDSVVCLNDGQAYVKSDAVFEVLRILGGGWRLLRVFKVLPRAFRDRVYDWIAANRYRWFGKKETCRMPTAEEKALFLP